MFVINLHIQLDLSIQFHATAGNLLSFLTSQRKFPYLENKSKFLQFPIQIIPILEMQEGKRKKLGKQGRPKKNNKKIPVFLFGLMGGEKKEGKIWKIALS